MGGTALEEGSRSTLLDDIDADDNYATRYLTPRARDEAERRSRGDWRCAHHGKGYCQSQTTQTTERPKPRRRHSPAVVDDLGRSSPLQMS